MSAFLTCSLWLQPFLKGLQLLGVMTPMMEDLDLVSERILRLEGEYCSLLKLSSPSRGEFL